MTIIQLRIGMNLRWYYRFELRLRRFEFCNLLRSKLRDCLLIFQNVFHLPLHLRFDNICGWSDLFKTFMLLLDDVRLVFKYYRILIQNFTSCPCWILTTYAYWSDPNGYILWGLSTWSNFRYAMLIWLWFLALEFVHNSLTF
jgi:hypothetical protein